MMRVADVLTWHNRQFHLARKVLGGWQASRHGGEAVQGSQGDNLFFLVASEAWWTGFTGGRGRLSAKWILEAWCCLFVLCFAWPCL
jgi:hypothetical protein